MPQETQAPESPQDSQQQAQSEQGQQQQEAPKAQSSEDHYYKRQFEKSEKRVKDLERATMTEAQRLVAERDELNSQNAALKAEIEDHRMYQQFEKTAKAGGVIDTEVAWLLAKSSLKLSDGKLSGADQFLKDLKQQRPHLFASQAMGSGGGIKRQAQPSKTPGESLARWVRQNSR